MATPRKPIRHPARPKPPGPVEVPLDKLLDAVNEAAKRETTQWFFLISIMLALGAIIASTSHRILFLAGNVKVPLLSVDLPVVGFYWVGPLVLLVLHFYTLASLQLLAGKTEAFLARLNAEADAPAREAMLRRLDNFAVVQLLAHEGMGRRPWAMAIMAWTTLAVAPVGVLLWFLVRFLPYHDEWQTMFHRVVIVADIAMFWWFWRGIEARLDGWGRVWAWLRGAAVAAVVFFSFGMATIPGPEAWLPEWWWRNPAAVWAFGLEPDSSAALGSRSVRLEYEHFVEMSDAQLQGRFVSIELNERNLDYANLRNTDLRMVHIIGGSAAGADLRFSRMHNASVIGVSMQGANFGMADLNGAFVSMARMQGADFNRTRFQGAWLNQVQLQGASLDYALMQGAVIMDAALQGASFNGTRLDGASLVRAQLQGSRFSNSRLEGTSITHASAWRIQVAGDLTNLHLSDIDHSDSLPCEHGFPHCNERVSWTDAERMWLSSVPAGQLRAAMAGRFQGLRGANDDQRTRPLNGVPAFQFDDRDATADVARRLADMGCSNDPDSVPATALVKQASLSIGLLEGPRPLGSAAWAIFARRLLDVATCPGAANLLETDREVLRALAR